MGHYFDASPSVSSRPGSVVLGVGDRVLRLSTDRGVFGGSSSSIDRGTAVLLRVASAPEVSVGDVLDLGCGYGPIALWAASLAPRARVWAVDVNERAVALTAANAAAAGLSNVRACLPDAVPVGVTFDAIYSNPPIRIGKDVLHSLLLTWLGRLHVASGVAWLVVQRHLGSDSLEAWLRSVGFDASRAASKGGYRVLRVTRLA